LATWQRCRKCMTLGMLKKFYEKLRKRPFGNVAAISGEIKKI